MTPDDPPTNPHLDAAIMNTAHQDRIYFLALVAEGFNAQEAMWLVAEYRRALTGLAAMLPPIKPQEGKA